MPRVEFSKTTRKAADEIRSMTKDDYISPSKAKAVAEQHQLIFCGKGSECVVVQTPGTETVEAFLHSKKLLPREAKFIYYSHRILATLFPNNFPRITAAFGRPHRHNNHTGTIRKFVEGNKHENGYCTLDRVSKFPFQEVRRIREKLDLPVIIDPHQSNYLLAENGGVYYLDTLYPSIHQIWDKEKIASFMKSRRYTNVDIKTVMKSIGRIEALNK